MKKFFIAFGVVVILASNGFAAQDTASFNVTVNIKAADGISISATQNHMEGTNEVFGPTVTAMNFDPMSFDGTNGIWTSAHFFAVDVAATGGAGAPNVTVTYGNESNPTNQVKGLGHKATANFNKVTGGPLPADQTETPIFNKMLLKSMASGFDINNADILGGFMRMRVGIYDGADATLNAAPNNGEPFTNGDAHGPYTGTITVTALNV